MQISRAVAFSRETIHSSRKLKFDTESEMRLLIQNKLERESQNSGKASAIISSTVCHRDLKCTKDEEFYINPDFIFTEIGSRGKCKAGKVGKLSD